MYKYVVVGAGFAGAVIAERIATQLKQKVLVIEQRNHIGGNSYDCYDDQGVLVHKYGPHIFHTKSREVWDYLSQFTDWYPYQHQVLGVVDGKKIPIPFNLNSLYDVFPEVMARSLEERLIRKFGYNVKVPILKLRETDDEQLKMLADFIYQKVFLRYTMKQWGVKPEELHSSVTGRVPVYISRDNRYFQDPYQGIPKHGYKKLFENLLTHPGIHLLLNTPFQEVLNFDTESGDTRLFGQKFTGTIVYTGKIDELFQYEFGELPYRSLRFEFESLDQEWFQETGTVNYPNDYDFTRVTEFKHMTGQRIGRTTIVREYPQPYDRSKRGQDIPYYPIQDDANMGLYRKYKEKAKQFSHLVLLGRLAEYHYYDMDAVIAKALRVFRDRIQTEL